MQKLFSKFQSLLLLFEYFLSDDAGNAVINIYDMSGTQLKSIELYQKEYGNITVNGSEFNV